MSHEAVSTDQQINTQEPTRKQIKRWRKHLAEERMEARTYRDLSERRTGEERAVLLQLEEAERRHEEYWLARLGEHALPAPKPPLRTRAASVLAHLFGTIFILAMAQRAEQRSARDVDDDVPTHMQADEQIHAEVIRSLAAKSRETLAGTFRAAVFGANDGLVSNLALVLGVAASGMEPHAVLLTGVSGLLAGALSMAAGEWVSVRSQRELLDASIPDPDAHQAVTDLDVDANELALVFRARGESEEEAERHAKQVFARLAKPATGESGAIAVRAALDGSAESDGAGDQVGTPTKAALSSFCFFAPDGPDGYRRCGRDRRRRPAVYGRRGRHPFGAGADASRAASAPRGLRRRGRHLPAGPAVRHDGRLTLRPGRNRTRPGPPRASTDLKGVVRRPRPAFPYRHAVTLARLVVA